VLGSPLVRAPTLGRSFGPIESADGKEVNVLRMYETPTLTHLGTFAGSTGRFFTGFFADGQGGWDWGPTKYDPNA
jgi:hypothetical protein